MNLTDCGSQPKSFFLQIFTNILYLVKHYSTGSLYKLLKIIGYNALSIVPSVNYSARHYNIKK